MLSDAIVGGIELIYFGIDIIGHFVSETMIIMN